MIIRDMFENDINRKIQGVIQVNQDVSNIIEQELNEYVITKELKKHFISFFNSYSDAFDEPTVDIGVWISGFFGSGKSHFLKMLSYILENKEVKGIKTVEKFRDKFDDDPATFMLIDKSTKNETETILFNIDIEGSINKDKTAVMRVFAKMFYNHLGFYGENLKVAKLEQFIEKQGKTEQFRRVFEEKNGEAWVATRDAFAFFEDDVVDTLVEVLGMSEISAHNWFDSTDEVDMSIAQLVSEIKEYVDNKSKDFRLLFMIDEVGQYVGTDTDMLLNLQSLVEEIGSKCNGKVWVVCTGQEAIDEIIKVRADEFSRIQARFKTRLSLSSSSVDEVIQKRILKKKPEISVELEKLYAKNNSILRNLFSFSDSVLDIKGYSGGNEFAINFPFVPYQFIIMQKVFAEIRKHGNSGKHLSGGERSMLSGFQEAVQKIQEKDENSLVPFFYFYDTVHTFLDSSIRRVIERCDRAAEKGHGIEKQDVNILKLLYLIRYIDNDIKANIDNIVILMADNINIDKITMREKVRQSLDRLLSQNYIARTGDTYNFLTDEEQDIQREIKNTPVDTADIVNRIGQMIFGDIYTAKKYRYGKYDFAFDSMVDGMTIGSTTGGMKLRFLTIATDNMQKTELKLVTDSDKQAIVVLGDTLYYEALENAMKIRKYIKQRNVSQLPKSVQDIIRNQQDEATKYEITAMEELNKAILSAEFYVDKEHIQTKGKESKSKIDQALEYLVSHVYNNLNLITKNFDSDTDVIMILNGSSYAGLTPGYIDNRDAAVNVEEYLEMQNIKNLPTSMADIQKRYSAIPYGWREIDIAAVVALLIYEQKVTIKYAGVTIQTDNPKLPDMLRKKTEIGKVSISKRIVIPINKIKQIKNFLRDYFDIMDVPNDEDGLIKFIVQKFDEQKSHYEELDKLYDGHKYPDNVLVKNSMFLTNEILSKKSDNIALVNEIIRKQEDLYDNKEDMQNVEGFFNNQVAIFDKAVEFEANLRDDLEYIESNKEANDALNKIRLITLVQSGSRYNYKRIPELNTLMPIVKSIHDELLKEKREEILEVVRQCMEAIHTKADGEPRVKEVVTKSDNYFTQKKEIISNTESLALLDGLISPMILYKDNAFETIEIMIKPVEVQPPKEGKNKYGNASKKENIKDVYRQAIFPSKTLKTEKDVDDYVEKMRSQLKQLIKNCDGIKLN